jgi:hypothetical protein
MGTFRKYQSAVMKSVHLGEGNILPIYGNWAGALILANPLADELAHIAHAAASI